MSCTEKDPRDTGYIALLIAIAWYKLIPSEAALRIAQGKSSAKPGRKPTPEIMEQVKRIVNSVNFKNFNSIEKKYKVNRYDIIISEEVFALSQIEMLTKRLKNQAENCAGECEKCILNAEVSDEYTMCEFLCDVDLKNPRRPENKRLQKNAENCSLSGEIKTRGFEVYKSVLDKFSEYMDKNKSKKIRDTVSAALLEYMERHR